MKKTNLVIEDTSEQQAPRYRSVDPSEIVGRKFTSQSYDQGWGNSPGNPTSHPGNHPGNYDMNSVNYIIDKANLSNDQIPNNYANPNQYNQNEYQDASQHRGGETQQYPRQGPPIGQGDSPYNQSPHPRQDFNNANNRQPRPNQPMQSNYQQNGRLNLNKDNNLPITPLAKKRIETLLGITEQTRSVIINKIEFVIKVIKGSEFKDAFSAINDKETNVYNLMRQILARCIKKVDGVLLDELLQSDSIESKLYFIDQLDVYIVNHLYSQYSELVKEVNSLFDRVEDIGEEIKK